MRTLFGAISSSCALRIGAKPHHPLRIYLSFGETDPGFCFWASVETERVTTGHQATMRPELSIRNGCHLTHQGDQTRPCSWAYTLLRHEVGHAQLYSTVREGVLTVRAQSRF